MSAVLCNSTGATAFIRYVQELLKTLAKPLEISTAKRKDKTFPTYLKFMHYEDVPAQLVVVSAVQAGPDS